MQEILHFSQFLALVSTDMYHVAIVKFDIFSSIIEKI